MNRVQILLLRVQSVLSWLFCAFIGAPFTWLFIKLFSCKVYHKERLKGLKPPFILVSNHLTLIDSWFIAYALCFPESYWKPWLLLWHLPEKTNYYRGLLVPFMWLTRSIPIIRGAAPKEQKLAKDKIINILQNNEAIHIFPEGTRSRSGRIEDFTTGIGRIYQRVPNCTILPVYIRGTEKVLPIKSIFPRLFKKIDVVIGRPRKLTSEHKGLRAGVDISRQIFDILLEMEKEYFESKEYRAREILGVKEKSQ
ncbi:MAG: lysophospholipid acyltransferase family protein [Candidatus Margulisiibacteriota bacterium]